MAAQPQIVSLLDTLGSESDFAEIAFDEEILLTPYLTLACGLLYMMASDGHLGEQESSHLQGVLGGDGKVLSYALRYVQTVPLEKFLHDAPEVLSAKDKWCILTNVSDALLADGHADEAELALFSRLAEAFGVPEKSLNPSLAVLKLKNDKTVLGRYAGVKAERQPMTPHFALAASLLYMLTADGSIGAQEIGQLEAVIGEFEGLQNAALKYVRAVKLKPFLDEASATLNQAQKLYILTNVCDSMLSDGSVGRLEDKVFIAMVQAYGFDEKSFAPYYQVLETKNFKPFECSFKNRAVHQHASVTDQHKVDAGTPDTAANQGVWSTAQSDLAMGDTISRTMQENIQSVKNSFDTQENVALVGLNATDELNLQKLGGDDAPNNRQKVETGIDDESNRQKLAQDALALNRQQIDQSPTSANQQRLPSGVAPAHVELLDTEVRVQHIYEVVGEVNQRLDHFERQHFSFLQVGRAVRYDDSFAPIKHDVAETNRQRVDSSPQQLATVQFSQGAQVAQVAQGGVEPEVSAGDMPLTKLGLSNGVDAASIASANVGATGTPHQTRTHFTKRSVRSDVNGFRMTRLQYAQLITAFATLMFAAPISTKTSLSRMAVGPLIVLSQDQAMDARDLNVP